MSTNERRAAPPASADVSSTRAEAPAPQPVFRLRDVTVSYGDVPAVVDVDLDVPPASITALIGPSGCGKSTLLRAMNRMNELTPGVRLSGSVIYRGEDLYARGVDPMVVRSRIGMVFQRPNPFAMSIRDNVAFGPRLHRRVRRRALDDLVEASLRAAALWDEVKDLLDRPAIQLSGGQQQRLCIARALANGSDALLLDEPCSSLDPISTHRIEDLLRELSQDLAIVLVTHDLQQAARVSDSTAFLSTDLTGETPGGRLIEHAPTDRLFTLPSDPRTEAYITGRYG